MGWCRQSTFFLKKRKYYNKPQRYARSLMHTKCRRLLISIEKRKHYYKPQRYAGSLMHTKCCRKDMWILLVWCIITLITVNYHSDLKYSNISTCCWQKLINKELGYARFRKIKQFLSDRTLVRILASVYTALVFISKMFFPCYPGNFFLKGGGQIYVWLFCYPIN